MSRRVLAILLVVSMLFNGAVLIGFLKSQREAAAPPERPPETAPANQTPLTRLARELRFDPTQSEALQDLQRRQQQQQAVFGDSQMVLRQDLQNELRKSDPDLERVRTLVDQEADVSRQRRQAEAELYGEFVSLLTPQQRQQLGNRFAPPRQKAPPPPDVVRRFDRNNNGRLDPDEVRQARKELEGRRREIAPHVQQLPPLWPWFDQDGDGELNQAERDSMEAFLSEHRPAKALPLQQGPDGRLGGDRRDRGGQGPGGGRGQRGNPRQPPQEPPVPDDDGNPPPTPPPLPQQPPPDSQPGA